MYLVKKGLSGFRYGLFNQHFGRKLPSFLYRVFVTKARFEHLLFEFRSFGDFVRV